VENALEPWVTPMQDLASSTSVGKFSKSKLCRNARSFFCSSSERPGPGTMATEILIIDACRRMTSVAKRVQRLSLVGKGIPEMASKTELLPDD